MSFSDKAKKPLLLTTAAFLATCPILVAEQAQAQSLTLTSSSVRIEQQRLRTSIATLLQTLPKTNPGQSQSALDASFQSLRSILTDLQAQVNSLDTSNPVDIPAQQSLLSKLRDLNVRIDRIADIQKELKAASTALTEASTALTSAQEALTIATTSLSTAKTALDQAKQDKDSAQSVYDQALTAKNDAQAAADTAQQTYDDALAAVTLAENNLASKTTAAETASRELVQASQTLQTSEQVLNSARAELQTAQSNYDNNLIPDPNWIAPTQQVEHTRQVANTRLVPHTELVQRTGYSFNESANILPTLSASTWSGAGTGFQGSQPAINDGILKFSYMNQTVSYTANANLSGTLSLTVDVKNLDQNRNQQDTYELRLTTYDAWGNINGEAYYYGNNWHDWNAKTVEVTPTSQVASYKVDLTGFDGGYWYGTYGPEMRNPRLAGYVTTETTYFEEVTTYTEETYYTTETYYTEEPVLTQGTIQVDIREGGQATFTAPAGATFTGSNLRYEAIARPTCGSNITPQLDGLSSITIRALNSVWGDHCGGWVKHVVGTLTYFGQPTAPLIPDPALLAILEQKQAAYELAQSAYDQNLSVYQTASNTDESAQIGKTSASSSYSEALDNLTQATINRTATAQELDTKQDNLDTTSNELSLKVAALRTAQTEYSAAEQTKNTAESNQQTASETVTTAQSTYDTKASAYSASINTTADDAESLSQEVSAFTPTPIPPTPEPEPEPQGPAQEGLPEEISSDTLTEINFETVDPSQLSDEQVTALQEAAYETFLTAEEGSTEYEAALDALYLAAEADDIVLSEELAAIPGAEQVVAVINLLSNVGADMNPEKRKDAQQLVVTTVVVGQIAQAAAASTTSIRRK